jgi:hypothetical protein
MESGSQVAHVLWLKTSSGLRTQQPEPHHNTKTFKASAALTTSAFKHQHT